MRGGEDEQTRDEKGEVQRAEKGRKRRERTLSHIVSNT
jgi:hypothetical protein